MKKERVVVVVVVVLEMFNTSIQDPRVSMIFTPVPFIS
jgi:hypothetical protein